MTKKIKHHWRAGRPSGQISPRAAVIFGAPDDRGVLNVGGRLGAGHGPVAIRQQLSQFMLGIDGAIGRLELFAGDDIAPGDSIEAGHRALRAAVATACGAGQVPVVLGGGHDYGYPHFAGAVDGLGSKVGLINVDAHLDVRPPGPDGITSGSPFYLALEEGVLKGDRFFEFGIQEHCNDDAFRAYAAGHGARIMMLGECRSGGGVVAQFQRALAQLSRRGLRTVVSLDIDAVAMAFSPGVSAPQSDGLTSGEFLELAQICGESPDVASIGIFETAPLLDDGGKTVRLAATAVHRFLCGLSRRGEKKRAKKTRSAVKRLLLRR